MIVAVTALLLIGDAILWFFLERPVYAAARYDLIHQKKLLFALGLGLLGVAVPGYDLRAVLSIIGK